MVENSYFCFFEDFCYCSIDRRRYEMVGTEPVWYDTIHTHECTYDYDPSAKQGEVDVSFVLHRGLRLRSHEIEHLEITS